MKHDIGGLEAALQECKLRIEQFEAREEQWKGELHHLQDQVGNRDYLMGEALVQDQLQEQLAKMQNDMREQMLEAQKNMMAEMSQLLRATDKGKAPMTITGEDGEDHPLGFTPPHVPTPTEALPRRPSVSIRPQQGSVDAGIPINFPTGSGFNLGDNPVNLVIPDLDMAEKEVFRTEAARQLEERYKWLEEKFKALENADGHHRVDAKDLSLVPDLIWRKVAIQVQPPLLEKESTMLFINTLKAPFITHMIGNTTKSFANIVMVGEMIENAIRGGKIEGEATKRLAPMRKDSEVNNTSTFNVKAITVGQLKTAAVKQQSYQRQELGTRKNSERMQFTPIPVTCEYHAGIPGHSIENCTCFKKAVERLIKMGVVKFDNTPNTKNPLPNHSDQGVNAISEASERRMKEDVAEVRMPMKVIWEEMMKRGMLTSKNERRETRNYGEFHEKEGHEVQDCEEFKALKGTSWPRIIISLLRNNKVGAYTEPKVIIHKPTPFPYKDSNRVPWSYGCSVTVPEEENIVSTSKDVQVEGPHTRSGKRYDMVGVKEEPTKLKNVSAEKEKEAEVPVKELVKEEKAKEFLKFLKHSKYSMVEQLRRQPARISVLALLLSSEVHRNALLRVLNETYVTHDISVNKLDRLVNNISANNFIYFNDNEIPPGGRGSTKALHITTRCKGYTLSSVLVDNGSALKVLPLSTLNRLPIDGSHMKTCQNMVRAFDGTERKVIGRIDIPLEIGPRRPWIHSAGAVPSSLHQKLKLVTDGRLVTINAEEDIIATVTSKAPYVETNEEFIECSFRTLEFVNPTFISEGSEPPVPKIARMALQMMVGKEALPGRGLGKYLQGGIQIPELKEKRDHFGLGFKPDYKQRRKEVEKRQEGRRARHNGRKVE
ncbi:uncharacterized protein [Gossypium hirsutum]|uniref:G-patch domain-containing protein n=1 Tax=Gossypium hirsutum TaxID=3635 RepID=A0ABM2ZGA7_GOSHI|nr:uncharacterized protein LOC121212347 [Gossypium hirsutum]